MSYPPIDDDKRISPVFIITSGILGVGGYLDRYNIVDSISRRSYIDVLVG